MTGAQELTQELGGRWAGQYGTAACPVCQPDRRRDQNALTLADGQAGLLLDCKKTGCAFVDILAAAGLRPGAYQPPDPARAAQREAERLADIAKRARRAGRLWNESRPIVGTPAQRYLEGRGIRCAPLPKTLRFHPAAYHGAMGVRLPALVALVEGGDGFAVHRTYLRPDGSGKADITPDKAMLGRCAGGAVRLADGPGRLVVAEGVETALSLLSGLLDGPAAVWAALSTSGLRGLRLPDQRGNLTVASDGDDAGRAAARALAERAHALGWRVTIADPGDGRDFNDVLAGKAVTV
ncbi:MAG: DUF7146 domain-containing protein [Oceanicaulis sp.]